MDRNNTATSIDKKKNNQVIELTQDAQIQLFNKKRNMLPRIIKKRKKEFLNELENYGILKREQNNNEEYAIISDRRLPMIELSQHCFDPFIKWTGIIPKYSPQELMCIFDYFKNCIMELNKNEIFPPTKEQFCTLCGISTNQFSLWKTSDNPELREVLYQIEDYIANYLNVGGLTRKTSEVTGIFIQKSSLGRKEAIDTPIFTQQNNLILSEEEKQKLLQKFQN